MLTGADQVSQPMEDRGVQRGIVNPDAPQARPREPAPAVADRRPCRPAEGAAAPEDSKARHGEAAGSEDDKEATTTTNMKHLLWIAFVAGVVAVSWPKLATPALLVILVCGLVGLAYLALGTRGVGLRRRPEELDTRDVERDLPGPPG